MSTPQDPYGPQSQQPAGYPPPDASGYPAAPPPPQSGYPAGMPPPPGAGYTGDNRPVGRPGVVVGSVVLWVLTGLLFLLSGLVTALVGGNQAVQDQLDEVAAQSDVQIDPETLQQSIVVIGVVLAVLGGLLVILSLLMLRRSNAARILLTVLGVLVALALLFTVVGTLVVLVAIVLQFLPPANAWFRSRANAA